MSTTFSVFTLVSSVGVGVEGSVGRGDNVQKILVDFDGSCSGGFGVETCCLFAFDFEEYMERKGRKGITLV